MAKYYFVKVPKGIRISEARELIKQTCDSDVKSAARFCFFVKVNGGNLDAITKKTYEEDQTFVIEPSSKVNDENWDTLRLPASLRQNRDGNNNGPRTYQKREGEVVKSAPRTYKPRDTEARPSYQQRLRTQAPRNDAPRPKYEGEPRPFKAFCIADNYESVHKYFKNTLKTKITGVQTFEDKKHAFLTFETLDDCRDARSAFIEQPLENVIVRPFRKFVQKK